jgi:hypothetical protein
MIYSGTIQGRACTATTTSVYNHLAMRGYRLERTGMQTFRPMKAAYSLRLDAVRMRDSYSQE